MCIKLYIGEKAENYFCQMIGENPVSGTRPVDMLKDYNSKRGIKISPFGLFTK